MGLSMRDIGKILLSVFITASIISCSKSYIDRKDDLAGICLTDPDKYERIVTSIDSAYAPFDDPVFFEKTLEICKMSVRELDDSLTLEVQRCGQELIGMIGPGYRFIGYKVTQDYSLFDEDSELVTERKIYVLDKDMVNIYAEYDANSMDYIMVHAMYNLWHEETLKAYNN